MAVIKTKNPTGLKLRLACGRNEITGKTIIRSKTYSNVKPTANDDDIFAVGDAIAGLQEFAVQEIARIDNSTLSE